MDQKKMKEQIVQRAAGDLPDHLPVLSAEDEAAYKEIVKILIDADKPELVTRLKNMRDKLSYFDNFCREMLSYRDQIKFEENEH